MAKVAAVNNSKAPKTGDSTDLDLAICAAEFSFV